MAKKKVKKYQFIYVFECADGYTPGETVDQEFYDITANNENISNYGKIEEVK